MNVSAMVGPDTIRRMEQTKWWQFALLIDQILYDGMVVKRFLQDRKGWQISTETTADGPSTEDAFFVAERVYAGHGNKSMHLGECYASTEAGNYILVSKFLRTLQHEFLVTALREVCP